ncbi:MAG: hypothetical protein NTV63_05710 [Candidatus Woesearchaeota archaeon]|nr:hypothetical protein [Candidatus Woesearchaeota archaeon]
MKKEIMEKLNEEEKDDEAALREIISREKGLDAIVSIFSARIASRYGAEFGGVLRLNYKPLEKEIEIITPAKDAEIRIKADDISELPNQIMILRERKKKMEEILEWKKSRNLA